MTILLDTHRFIWFVEGNATLKNSYRVLIEDQNNQIYLSIASVWEMAIKAGLGKLTLAQPLEQLLPEQLIKNRIEILPKKHKQPLPIV
jgi:PIN domain nuclease of toxin-antitoxin system